MLKLGLSPQESDKEAPVEDASARSLKLFGKTVLITGSHRHSSSNVKDCKVFASDMSEGKALQLVPLKLVGTEASMHTSLAHASTADERSKLVGAQSGASMPCWTFYGGVKFPITPYHKQEPVKIHVDSNLKELKKEGSWTGSNSKSVNEEEENCEKCSDIEAQSRQHSGDREEKEGDSVFELKPSVKSAFSVIRGSRGKCMKGFVPYKRHMAEREGGEEREEQRIRLCL